MGVFRQVGGVDRVLGCCQYPWPSIQSNIALASMCA